MKNSTYYFRSVLFLVFIFSNSIFAQESASSPMHFSLFGGLALPQGDFGNTGNGSYDDKAGFANTGFFAMLEAAKNLNESVKWVSSLSLALNSLDESAMKSNYFDSDYKVTTGSYLTSWAMTGIGYETAISPTINIYGVGQIGLLLSSFPNIKVSYRGSPEATATTKGGTSFAYGFGAGVIINKINIGLRYYSGKPEYEQPGGYYYYTYQGEFTTSTEKVQRPATILQLMVGINL